MERTHQLPRVYEYLDNREFLSDTWGALRARSSRHSYRWFSRKAGLGSPSYLKHVIDGDRNLTDDTAQRFARGFDLDPAETRYFAALVRMNQAGTTEERSRWYEELSSQAPYRATHRLDRSQYDYYALWYCVPVRELVARADFVDDPEWIARGEDGCLHQSESLLTTGPQLRLIALRRFHQQMLRRAEEAKAQVPLHEREVGGVTLRLTEAQVRLLERRLYDLRQEILQMDAADEGAQAVHHFAFQLFPVTRWPEPESPAAPPFESNGSSGSSGRGRGG